MKKNHTVAITSDGAKSWKNIIVETDEELRKVLFTSESNGWLIGEKGIYNTIDTGNTWQNELNKGKHEIIFNAEELTSGIYFYQILTYNHQETRKCILLK